MWFCGFYKKYYLFFCILVLHRKLEVSCSSSELQQFSEKYFNMRLLQNNTRPSNLSELIEYSPISFPLEFENISITSHEAPTESHPRIITLKLKTHIKVENNENNHQSSPFYSPVDKREIKEKTALTDGSLKDVEYVANKQDRIAWQNTEKSDPQWLGYGKVEKLFTSKQENIPDVEFNKESKRSIGQELLKNVELGLVEGKFEPGNIDNSKWHGFGRIEKINTPEENQTENKLVEDTNSSKTEEIPKSMELIITDDGIKLDNPGNLKWRDYGNVEKVQIFVENETSENSSEESENLESEDTSKNAELMFDLENSEENKILPKNINRSKSAKGRQFVFHPYIPYGKDIAPDEKILFKDILPVKMVKFVKSMVEDAPWEQMFIKMVRMVVDQFVDKIIEKMFADKKDHFKKRSIDVFLSPSWILPTFDTSVVRLKRSIDSKIQSGEDEDFSTILTSIRRSQDTDVIQKKSPEERMSWLDHFLDFVFPNSKSNMTDDNTFDRLKKRDTHSAHLFKMLVALFMNAFEKTSGILTDAKDTFRYKMLKEILPYLYQKRHTISNEDVPSNSPNSLKMSHRKLENFIKRNDVSENNLERSARRKRSTRNHIDKEEKESRLWQSTSRRHRPQHHRSREDCSLRRACNAGRLLSRLPSVQDITLQLRSQGNEPHWDALIWGMKKKRCSRIFCKRQRSPKGSRHSWNEENERPSRKIEIVTEPPDDDLDETDNSTI